MMETVTLLMACAVFVALAAVAVTAALRAARVDDLIGEVFSPWIQTPFETSNAPDRSDRPSAERPAVRRRTG